MLGVVRTGEVLVDVGVEEFKGFHPLYLCLTDVKWTVLVCPPPQVDDHLLSLLCVSVEIICVAPGHQLSHLLPVVCLRPTSDQSDDCCVIRKLDDSGVVLGLFTFLKINFIHTDVWLVNNIFFISSECTITNTIPTEGYRNQKNGVK